MLDDYYLKINSCGTTDCSPEWHWDTDGFTDYDLWTVIKGKGEITVGAQTFTIESGDSFILPPNTSISASQELSDRLFTINVHFTLLKNSFPAFPLKLERRFIADINFFKNLLMRVISNFYREKDKTAKKWLNVCIEEFFVSPEICKNNITENGHIRCVEEICNSLNERNIQNLSLSDYAKQCGYSATYLGKIFHKVTGVSFSQYMLNAKINQAKTLLLTTEMSISEIAETLGYYDTSHFINQFKKKVGCSPNCYR